MNNFHETAGAAVQTAPTNGNGVKTENANGKSKKRQSNPPMWSILGKAKKKFDAQLHKDNSLKLKCVENYLAGETNDAPKFWGDFMKQVERLLDSRKYVKECQSLGYKPENVAEHIVFLGSATVNKVLTIGVSNTIGSHLKLYQDRFTSADVDFYRDDIIAFLKEGKTSDAAAA